MRPLPSGTVTFLFTDVEGSTRVARELGEGAFADALAHVLSAIGSCVETGGGVVFGTEGDAVFAAFSDARGALRAARESHARLADGPMQIRVGVHTGAPVIREGVYAGLDVHVAARVCAAGHKGQTLLSRAVAEAAVATDVVDLGFFRLRYVPEPVRLYQIGSDAFPAPRAAPWHELPSASSSFVGREQELAEVCALLRRDGVRLLTLTGPGGIGKSRLALAALAAVAGEHEDGVRIVELGSIADPELVPVELARALEVHRVETGAVEEAVEKAFALRDVVLCLDNFEHLLEAAPFIARLLRSSVSSKILATSRAALRVGGEFEYAVPQLGEEEAIALFAERAVAARSAFELGERERDTVQAICASLDHLPLAIELAAARVRVLSTTALHNRLDKRLALLTSGMRDAPDRQRTLRRTIDWSYELLDSEQRRLLAELSIFAGGATIEAAEAVCGATLDGIEALAEKSLLTVSERDDEPRLSLLETIREYAAERLQELGDPIALGRRHADYFAALAEAMEGDLVGPDQVRAMGVLDVEIDNLRAAMTWSLEHDDAERALRIAAALLRYWLQRGVPEGRRWLQASLDHEDSGAGGPTRARALLAIGRLTHIQTDYGAASTSLRAAIERAGSEGDLSTVAEALASLMWCYEDLGRDEQAADCLTELRPLLPRLDDEWQRAELTHMVGASLFETGELDEGMGALADGLALSRQVGDLYAVARAASNIGWYMLRLGDHGHAAPLLEEAIRVAEQTGNTFMVATARTNLGNAAILDDRLERARALYLEALPSLQLNGATHDIIEVLVGLALGIAPADPERSVRIVGATIAAHATLGSVSTGLEQMLVDRVMALTGESLGPERVDAISAEGAALTLEEALTLATDGVEARAA